MSISAGLTFSESLKHFETCLKFKRGSVLDIKYFRVSVCELGNTFYLLLNVNI